MCEQEVYLVLDRHLGRVQDVVVDLSGVQDLPRLPHPQPHARHGQLISPAFPARLRSTG